MGEEFDEATMDARLIAAGQRAEHYEMAAYGTLVAWARAMKHDEVADLLQQTLDEEKAADEKLSSLAEGGINQEAADLAHPDQSDEEDEDEEEEENVTAPVQAARGSRGKAVAAPKAKRAKA
jgi:hypothetical protein